MLALKKRGLTRVELRAAAGDEPAIAVTVRPPLAVDWDIAQGLAGRAIRAVIEGGEAGARYGVGDIPEGDLEAGLSASGVVLAIEMGARHIVSWEGLGNEAGDAPAEITPENIALLMNAAADDIGTSFARIFLGKMRGLSPLEPASGNVSTASPATSGAAAVTPA